MICCFSQVIKKLSFIMSSILFKTRFFWKHFGLVIARSKTSSTPQGKKVLGETIKRLNKENKSLFGHLLNRPDHKAPRKLQSNKASAITSTTPLDGIQHEAHWYKSISHSEEVSEASGEGSDDAREGNLKKRVKVKKQVKKSVVVDENMSSEYLSKRDKPTAKQHLKEHVAEDHFIKPADDAEWSDKGVIPNNGPTLTPHPVKTPHLKLPHIIIRNITSFPLWNEEKKQDTWLTPGDAPLNFPRDNQQFLAYPSVTRILNATMSDASRTALEKWKKKLVAELGEEGFEEFHRAQLQQGSQFHSTVESYLSGTLEPDLEVGPDVEGCWQSLAAVIPDIGNVHVLESHVVHHKLMYRGVIDCVAEYRGKPMLIEWKKSEKPKPQLWNTYDAPLQLMAYLGAMSFDHNYNFQVRSGLVVVAYTSGAPANVFPVASADSLRHWNMWLRRLQQYWLQQDILQQDSLRQDSLRQDSLRQDTARQDKEHQESRQG